MHHQDEETTQQQTAAQQPEDTAQEEGIAIERPRHYTGGNITEEGKRILEGRDLPKPGQLQEGDQELYDNGPAPQEDLPPAPVGMKPNDLIAMPPGSVNAPSSFPGGAPPTDVVVPEPEEPPAE